jgi:hypothetical protein
MPAETDVLQFCATVFKSVWALGVLLSLKRDPGVARRAAGLVKDLRCSSGLVAEFLPISCCC